MLINLVEEKENKKKLPQEKLIIDPWSSKRSFIRLWLSYGHRPLGNALMSKCPPTPELTFASSPE